MVYIGCIIFCACFLLFFCCSEIYCVNICKYSVCHGWKLSPCFSTSGWFIAFDVIGKVFTLEFSLINCCENGKRSNSNGVVIVYEDFIWQHAVIIFRQWRSVRLVEMVGGDVLLDLNISVYLLLTFLFIYYYYSTNPTLLFSVYTD